RLDAELLHRAAEVLPRGEETAERAESPAVGRADGADDGRRLAFRLNIGEHVDRWRRTRRAGDGLGIARLIPQDQPARVLRVLGALHRAGRLPADAVRRLAIGHRPVRDAAHAGRVHRLYRADRLVVFSLHGVVDRADDHEPGLQSNRAAGTGALGRQDPGAGHDRHEKKRARHGCAGSSMLYSVAPARLRSSAVSARVFAFARSRPKNWNPSDGGRLPFMPCGMPTNFTSGPNVLSSGFGPNVPALSGPATNSQNGSNAVNAARDGS